MKKKEAQFGILLRHWIMANAKDLETCTFEIKQTETDSIPFNALEDHQVNFNLAIKHGKKGVLIRNEAGTIGAPDYSYFKKSLAYIVIKFPKCFCTIDVDMFLLEKKRSHRKSLTSERACKIATTVVNL